MNHQSVIEIESLNLVIEDNNLISNFSLSINNNERVGITGPSGCGKSTLLNSLINNHCPNGSSFISFTKNDNLNYSFVPQTNGLLPWYSLSRNLQIFKKDSKLYDEVINKFKLFGSLNIFPHQLSGGEYQRALLACAIINKPHIYLADEPLTELDITKKWELLSYWSEHISTDKTALFLISHDIDTLLYMCDRILILSDKPANVIKEIQISEPHKRNINFLISNTFIEAKKQILESIKNGK